MLHIFSWDHWSDINDRFPGHPMSVDACIAFTEDIIFTGSMDGIIRYIICVSDEIAKCVLTIRHYIPM